MKSDVKLSPFCLYHAERYIKSRQSGLVGEAGSELFLRHVGKEQLGGYEDPLLVAALVVAKFMRQRRDECKELRKNVEEMKKATEDILPLATCHASSVGLSQGLPAGQFHPQHAKYFIKIASMLGENYDRLKEMAQQSLTKTKKEKQ